MRTNTSMASLYKISFLACQTDIMLIFLYLFFIFCTWCSVRTESPIHLLLLQNRDAVSCFLSIRAMANLQVYLTTEWKNISLPLSHPLALACSTSFSNSVVNKTKFRKNNLCSCRALWDIYFFLLYDATLRDEFEEMTWFNSMIYLLL